MVGRSAETLWQDYRFLTKEMLKFLAKQDMELFYDLMNQREQLQTLIEHAPDNGFKASSVGRRLINEIQQDSQVIIQEMQVRMGSSKRQHQVSEAYSAASTTAVNQMLKR